MSTQQVLFKKNEFNIWSKKNGKNPVINQIKYSKILAQNLNKTDILSCYDSISQGFQNIPFTIFSSHAIFFTRFRSTDTKTCKEEAEQERNDYIIAQHLNSILSYEEINKFKKDRRTHLVSGYKCGFEKNAELSYELTFLTLPYLLYLNILARLVQFPTVP